MAKQRSIAYRASCQIHICISWKQLRRLISVIDGDCNCVFFQHEAVGNMRKAKALYVQRQLDYDKAVKARDQATTRAEQDLSASSSSVTAKADKKRKLEEEAMHRVSFLLKIYRKISNIRHTTSQNINVSRLGLQLSLCNIMKPGVKWRMKM